MVKRLNAERKIVYNLRIGSEYWRSPLFREELPGQSMLNEKLIRSGKVSKSFLGRLRAGPYLKISATKKWWRSWLPMKQSCFPGRLKIIIIPCITGCSWGKWISRGMPRPPWWHQLSSPISIRRCERTNSWVILCGALTPGLRTGCSSN